MRLTRRVLLVAFALFAVASPTASAARFHSGHGLKMKSQKRLSKRLREATVSTTALPGPAKVRVLLPSGYAKHPHRRYPVLYLLHGTSGGADDWTTTGDAAKTTAGKPYIVVMPDIALNDDGGGWCSNWPNGPYQWERFHVSQLIPWIDSNLRTKRSRGGRQIAGLSQGGFCAFSYATRHPGLFSAAYSFSGPPNIAFGADAQLGTTTIITATEVGLDGVSPGSMFGDRVTNEVNYVAHDPATLVDNLRRTRLYLYTGNGSPGGPFDSQNPVDIPGNLSAGGIEALAHYDTLSFRDRASSQGIKTFVRDYGAGIHAWGYWARDLRWAQGKLMRNFRHPLKPSKAITYTSGDDTYSVYHWRVQMHRTARELSTLKRARCHGFTLQGSGSATVRTPRCLKPGARYRVRISTQTVGHKTYRARANRRGRLRMVVPLGPANPYQQYTAQADLAGTKVFTSRVNLKRLG